MKMSCKIRPVTSWRQSTALAVVMVVILIGLAGPRAVADGMVKAPVTYKGKPYQGSVEEQSQEAIIIFHKGDEKTSATQDLILKIRVEGEVENFAWVVPFPETPTTAKEDEALFKELHDYVEARRAAQSRRKAYKSDAKSAGDAEAPKAADEPVKVISRKIVGSFDVAVVQENKKGALNDWLKQEGFQQVEDADDVLDFYREKKYVYACIKVSDAALKKGTGVDLHPLRFSFKTGGIDGIYFPMKLTGLQSSAFDVNLYIFYDKWLNDRLSRFGYVHRGFELRWRDYDSSQCKPNAGKTWSDPDGDPYLKRHAGELPTVTKLFQTLHPGQRYYLTNIQAKGLRPADVREWKDDLWLFPYYTNRRFIPLDARQGGPAYEAYKQVVYEIEAETERNGMLAWILTPIAVVLLILVALALYRHKPARQ